KMPTAITVAASQTAGRTGLAPPPTARLAPAGEGSGISAKDDSDFSAWQEQPTAFSASAASANSWSPEAGAEPPVLAFGRVSVQNKPGARYPPLADACW